ncbi:GDP-fucose protein O-fucosyltransferase [Datura stramonium]|uniref:GDP-fucose protein O-fucosyltransferase n=1 Tax=Datura stramonium TaxID=4076 RepID=A0ABS8S7Q6_DATST|nr:GDP-fucose protein O-fucosyltransferase [Datura stramonium]
MMRERESSDEEDDRENLDPANERVNDHSKSPRRSPFQIDDVKDRFALGRRFNLNFGKRYFLAIILPVLKFPFFISLPTSRTYFRPQLPALHDGSVNSMRRVRIAALYLLRQQQLGLLNLWNHTQVNDTSSSYRGELLSGNQDPISTCLHEVSGQNVKPFDLFGKAYVLRSSAQPHFDVKKPKKRNVQDIISKFSTDDDVIAIGDVFFADVEKDWVMQPGGPISHKCKTLIEPSRLIMLTAQRFVQTFLGDNFIALHFRRHGFLKFCNAKSQVASTLSSACRLYQSVIERATSIPLFKGLLEIQMRNGMLTGRHGLEGDPQVEAMLDKTICAMSSVFIGSSGSTFTDDILRLRKDWGSASLCDEYLCQGELPNFTADDE